MSVLISVHLFTWPYMCVPMPNDARFQAVVWDGWFPVLKLKEGGMLGRGQQPSSQLHCGLQMISQGKKPCTEIEVGAKTDIFNLQFKDSL